MTDNKPVPAQDIDVLKYQKSLVEYMKSFPEYTDYDFEGSNFSVLLRLLALNAYNMAHYDGMVGNEAWVDTAELRQSQVSHATDLNYLPRSRISARAVVTVEVFPTDSPVTIILPKHYKFKTTDSNGKTIYFVTDRDYVVSADAQGRYIFRGVDVFQGEITEETIAISGVMVEGAHTIYDAPFVISSNNIDISSLEVWVSAGSGDATPIKYDYARHLSETSRSSQTYFLRGIYDDQYAIEFGDGTFGAPVTNGSIVTIRYRDTLGPVIQGNYILTKTTDIAGYNNISISMETRVQGGFERESVAELRLNAPRHFTTQDRSITSTDYEVIIKQHFPQIQQVSAFGGEEVQQYGKVMIVLKPFSTTGIVSDTVKMQMVAILKTKNIVPEPIIIDPDYYYIGISGSVFYDGDIIQVTEAQLKTNITKGLIDLNSNVIGDFNVVVHQSMINQVINSSDRSITGSDVRLDLRKRWFPAVNLNETLQFTSNNRLYKSRDGAYTNSNDYAITTSTFTIWHNEALRNVVIQDDGIGHLHYYTIDDSGNKIRIGQSIGSVDYDNGTINLIANVYEYGKHIEFIMRLESGTIQIIQDSFAIIDGADVAMKLVRA